MRLVYTATQKPVEIGDRVTVSGHELVVDYAPKPHKPDSSGKVSLVLPDGTSGPTYNVGVIGAEWIEREDRANLPPVTVVPSTAWKTADAAREAAIANVMDCADCDRATAEAIVDAAKVVIGGNWFCLDAKGDLFGGALNSDGTLAYDIGGHVDMADWQGDDSDMVHRAERMLRAGR